MLDSSLSVVCGSSQGSAPLARQHGITMNNQISYSLMLSYSINQQISMSSIPSEPPPGPPHSSQTTVAPSRTPASSSDVGEHVPEQILYEHGELSPKVPVGDEVPSSGRVLLVIIQDP
jgi:hypothetical protein